ncbi:hypothetical protein ColTof3_00622 [Colletotrichum tofieldiae]|nr:hypothetical protein ColTof3_00622 [Colletotrichum tofieldiae]
MPIHSCFLARDGTGSRGIFATTVVSLAVHPLDPLRLPLHRRGFNLLHDGQLVQHIPDQTTAPIQHSLQARHLGLAATAAATLVLSYLGVLELPQLGIPAPELSGERRGLFLPARVEPPAEADVRVGVEEGRGVGAVLGAGAGGLEVGEGGGPALEGADEAVVLAAGGVEGPEGREEGVEALDPVLEGGGRPAGAGRGLRPPPEGGDVEALGGVCLEAREAGRRRAEGRVPGGEPRARAGVPLGRCLGQVAVQEVQLEELGLQAGRLRGEGDVCGELGGGRGREVRRRQGFRGEGLGGGVVLLEGVEGRAEGGGFRWLSRRGGGRGLLEAGELRLRSRGGFEGTDVLAVRVGLVADAVVVVVAVEEREGAGGFEEGRSAVAEGGRGLAVDSDVGRDLAGAGPPWLGGRRTVLPLRVATLLARAWPFVGLDVVEDAALFSLEAGRPPDVVGLAVVAAADRVCAPVVDGARLLVEALAGCRARVSPGSLVEDVLVRPERALVLDSGAGGGGPEPADPAPAAAASFCRVDAAPAGWRVGAFRPKSVDMGFGFFFFVAVASETPVVPATLAPETLRVVGRGAARDRGAGSLLGETGRWAEAVGAVAAAAAAAAAVELDAAAGAVEVAGRSVEEPCVGFRSERVRARDDMMSWRSCGYPVLLLAFAWDAIGDAGPACWALGRGQKAGEAR